MSHHPAPAQPLTCLVTGATGYVGGRLVPQLLAAGYRVRCMAREAGRLVGFPWIGQVEVAEADALDPASLRRTLAVVDVAYYLIHSLGSGPAFEATAGPRRKPSPPVPALPGSAGSSTWAACARRTTGCPRTCVRGPRSGTSCSAPACPPRCCGPG
jgi:NAD(P)-dependent dehydrogenase (short-subunit alcohol dehydrogenase family)